MNGFEPGLDGSAWGCSWWDLVGGGLLVAVCSRSVLAGERRLKPKPVERSSTRRISMSAGVVASDAGTQPAVDSLKTTRGAISSVVNE